MQSQVSALLDSTLGVTCLLATAVATTVVVAKLSQGPSLDVFPTVGSSGWFALWWDGNNFERNALEIIQQGYEKYKSAPFKVADRYHWIVIFSSRQHMDEIRKAPDDALSLLEAANDAVKTKYTMGPELARSSYHLELVRSHLTRSLPGLYDAVREEVTVSFDGVLGLRDHEWKSVPALRAIQEVVCRTSNRLFVGLPLCRDPNWEDLNLRFTLDVVDAARIIKRYPAFLAPLVAHFMTNVPGRIKCGMKCLAPILEKRLRLIEKHGKDYDDQPNDMLSWMLDLAPEGRERTVRLLTLRLLSAGFAAIHTTSNSFTQALFYLAANPQYIRPLREEVESIVEKEGWSKSSLGKMGKIDSFLKESQRLAGFVSLSLSRKAVKDFTFSDGTFIPKGTFVSVSSRSLHLEEGNYPDAHTFNPFRFSDMRDEERDGTKHHFVSTSLDYLPFGHGKHACPGRFFAASEMKSMLAHIVMSYDVKLEDNQTHPEGKRVGGAIVPDPFAKVMFRKRVD